MLNDAADLDKVKQKILANPTRYSFPTIKKSEDTQDKDANADDHINKDHIYMTLHNPSHPVSQFICTSITKRLLSPAWFPSYFFEVVSK